MQKLTTNTWYLNHSNGVEVSMTRCPPISFGMITYIIKCDNTVWSYTFVDDGLDCLLAFEVAIERADFRTPTAQQYTRMETAYNELVAAIQATEKDEQ